MPDRTLMIGDYNNIQSAFENALTNQPSNNISRSPDTLVYAYLKNGGSRDMNVLGSLGTPVDFTYSRNDTWELTRLNITIIDAAINATTFGGIAALTNGCQFEIIDTDGTTVLLDFDNGEQIKANYDFAALAGSDVEITQTQGDDMLLCRFTVARSGAAARLEANQSVRFRVRDDLQALTFMTIMAQGIVIE